MRISKFTLPALTVAGALALAACGGGGGTTTVVDDNDDDDPVTLASATTSINACATAACVDGVVEGAEGDLTAAELVTLRATADARKTAIADGTPLTGLNVSAANQLADALAGSEALQLGSRHIDTKNAEPRGNVPWKDHETAGLPGGWEGEGWREPNPEGSSGEEQDMRVWTENPKHISEKYEAFFPSDGDTEKGFSARNTGTGASCTIIAVPAAVASLRLPPGRLSRARQSSGASRRAKVWRNVAFRRPAGAVRACPAAPSRSGAAAASDGGAGTGGVRS